MQNSSTLRTTESFEGRYPAMEKIANLKRRGPKCRPKNKRGLFAFHSVGTSLPRLLIWRVLISSLRTTALQGHQTPLLPSKGAFFNFCKGLTRPSLVFLRILALHGIRSSFLLPKPTLPMRVAHIRVPGRHCTARDAHSKPRIQTPLRRGSSLATPRSPTHPKGVSCKSPNERIQSYLLPKRCVLTSPCIPGMSFLELRLIQAWKIAVFCPFIPLFTVTDPLILIICACVS